MIKFDHLPYFMIKFENSSAIYLYILAHKSNQKMEEKPKPKAVRPHWEVGTVIDGVYYIGNWHRYVFLEVIKFDKGKPPVFRELEREHISESITSIDCYWKFCLKLPKEPEPSGRTYTARWQPGAEVWAINDKEGHRKIVCRKHADGYVYEEASYG